ncbi:MAG: Ig-like domain-containing protein [Bacillota bacterium]
MERTKSFAFMWIFFIIFSVLYLLSSTSLVEALSVKQDILNRSSYLVASADISPPAIILLNPSNNSTKINLDFKPSITFDENVIIGYGYITIKKTVDNSVVEQISAASGQVSIDMNNNKRVTIYPFSNFESDTDYYILIDGTCFKDSSGNFFSGINSSDTWNFRTKDVNAPSVVSFSPAANANNTAIDSYLTITFNEIIHKGTGRIYIHRAFDDYLVESIPVSSSNVTGFGSNTVTIHRDINFEYETAYYVLIPSTSFKDSSGNYYAGISFPAEWNFTTQDITPPSIESLYPSGNGLDVAIDSSLIITFQENVMPGNGSIIIRKASDNTIVESILANSTQISGVGTRTITIHPGSDFEKETEYYISIDSTAFQDMSGNYFPGINEPTAWNFHTQGEGPIILTHDPSHQQEHVDITQSITIIFNEDIYAGDNFQFITLQEGVQEINYDYDIHHRTLTIQPSSIFSYDTIYTITIPAGAVKDSLHNLLESAYSFSFRTKPAPDTQGPFIVGTIPENEAIKVAVDAVITISFNESIQPGESIDLIAIDEGESVMDYVYDIYENTLIINLDSDLDYGKLYTVTLPQASVTDAVYTPLEEDYVFQFTTIHSNAKLAALNLSSGTLLPSFSPAVDQYSVSLPYSISSIEMQAVPEDIHTSVAINHMSTGIQPITLPLVVGTNPVEILVTAEDGTTNGYTLSIIRQKKPSSNDNQDFNIEGTKSEVVNVPSYFNPSDIHTEADKMLDQAMASTGEAILSLDNFPDSSVEISTKIIEILAQNNKPIILLHKGLQLEFPPQSLLTEKFIEALHDLNSTIKLGIEPLAEEEIREILDLNQVARDRELFGIEDRLFNLTAQIITSDANGMIITEEISLFIEPIVITIDLSDLLLNPQEAALLTGIRYEMDLYGNIRSIKLGGTYHPKTQTFTFYTDHFSTYGIQKAEKLMTLQLTAGENTALADKEAVKLDAPPIFVNNRILVPLRFIAEHMDAQVTWFPKTETVTIEIDDKILHLDIDRLLEDFDASPIIVNNRTMVPLDYVSETLGAEVLWFPSTKTIMIIK